MSVLPLAAREVRVGEVMLRRPKTLPAVASIDAAREVLSNEHVHMVLLTTGTKLVGTLVRADLPREGAEGPALRWSTLVGRTVTPNAATEKVQRFMIERGIRRMAVVATDGSLVGLMCLKRHRTGFCSDVDVAARSGQERHE